MFEYFPDNYPWSMATLLALNTGAVLSEVDEACRDLRPLAAANDDAANAAWHASWSAIGERSERLAKTDEAAGHALSAGAKYLRAAAYFMTAERMCRADDPARFATYERMLTCFRRGITGCGDALEWIEIPYQDTSLPALFIPARTDAPRPPCLVHFDGLDVMKEYLYLIGLAREYARRGISVLLVDHPGVGEALRRRGLKLFPETEVPAAAALDYLETRDDVDCGRAGIAGISLGGYYAPRAAAYEPRFRCCVAWGAIWDYGPTTEGRIAGTGTVRSVSHWEEHMHWVLGASSSEELLAVTRRMSLAEAVPRIRCPLLVVHGAGDRQMPVELAERTVAHATASARADLKVFGPDEGGVEHCQCDHGQLAMEYMGDWVAEVLEAEAARQR